MRKNHAVGYGLGICLRGGHISSGHASLLSTDYILLHYGIVAGGSDAAFHGRVPVQPDRSSHVWYIWKPELGGFYGVTQYRTGICVRKQEFPQPCAGSIDYLFGACWIFRRTDVVGVYLCAARDGAISRWRAIHVPVFWNHSGAHANSRDQGIIVGRQCGDGFESVV